MARLAEINSLFRRVGNFVISPSNRSQFRATSRPQEALESKIPCIFPASREFGFRERVRTFRSPFFINSKDSSDLGSVREYLWAQGQYDRLPGIVADLVGRQVTVIVFVASLNRPGGNITGVVLLAELAAKRLDLLHEVLPTASIAALLVNPTNTANAEAQTTGLRDAARFAYKVSVPRFDLPPLACCHFLCRYPCMPGDRHELPAG